jgi:hypothetical protein
MLQSFQLHSRSARPVQLAVSVFPHNIFQIFSLLLQLALNSAAIEQRQRNLLLRGA